MQILEVLKPEKMDHLVVSYSLVWIETEGKLIRDGVGSRSYIGNSTMLLT